MTLPANIAERIDAAIRNNGSLVGAQAMQALRDLFAELAAERDHATTRYKELKREILPLRQERDRYRNALVARHGGEPLALLSELDAARAERDAAVAKCAAVTAQRDELLRVANWVLDRHFPKHQDGGEAWRALWAIARAQPEQPQQPQDGAP